LKSLVQREQKVLKNSPRLQETGQARPEEIVNLIRQMIFFRLQEILRTENRELWKKYEKPLDQSVIVIIVVIQRVKCSLE